MQRVRSISGRLALLGLFLLLGGLVQGVRVHALGFYQSTPSGAWYGFGADIDHTSADGIIDDDLGIEPVSDRYYHFEGGQFWPPDAWASPEVRGRYYHVLGTRFTPPLYAYELGNAVTYSVIYRTDRVGHTSPFCGCAEPATRAGASDHARAAAGLNLAPDRDVPSIAIYEVVQITVNYATFLDNGYTVEDIGTKTFTSTDYAQANARLLGMLALGVALLAIMGSLWWFSKRRLAAAEALTPQFGLLVREARAARAGTLVGTGWLLLLGGTVLYFAFTLLILPDFSGIISSMLLVAPVLGIVALVWGYALRRRRSPRSLRGSQAVTWS